MKITNEMKNALISVRDNDDFEYRSYSGRGMFGQHCLGVVTDNIVSFVRILITEFVLECVNNPELGDIENQIEKMDWIDDYRSDNMGRSMIYYFPDFDDEKIINEIIGEDDYDEDEDTDEDE